MPHAARGRSMSFPSAPVHDNLFRRRAAVALDIIVIGAGLSGLSAAYNLRQAGHNVRVLEKRKGKPEVWSGLRVPPNMAKLLQHWGLGERFREKAVSCPKIDFMTGASGERLSSIIYHPELMKEFQADMYGVSFHDLYDMVFEIVEASGVEVKFDTRVKEVDAAKPAVLLADNSIYDADMIVGADGVNSVVRKQIPYGDEPLEYGTASNYSFLVPVTEMEKDPLLAPLVKDGTWSLWTGNNSCSLNYRVSAEDYLVTIFGIHSLGRGDDSWAVKIPISEIEASASEYEERVHRLIALGKEAIPTQHVKPPQIEDWFSEDGKLVLVGESIHPDSPDSTNGPALTFEDGAVLGSLFSRLQSRDQEEILRLLRAYQEIRQDRCINTLKTDADLVVFCCLPPGPSRDKRDEGLIQSEANHSLDWGEECESILRSAWEEFRESFGYEAYDAADDWWVDWGAMIQRINAAKSSTLSISNDDYSAFEEETSLAKVFAGSVQVTSVS